MVRAKRAAERYLLGERELLTVPTIFNHVKSVWESQKRLVAKRIELNNIIALGREIEERATEEENKLNARLVEAAMTIFTYGNNIDDPNDIFVEGAGNAHRMQLATITEM